MNFIQIHGSMINPKKIRNLVSCDLVGSHCPLIHVNFYPPLTDVVFVFRNEKDRDNKFNDIRKRQGV